VNLLKIVLIVHYFLPKWLGGTEIATYYLAEHLAQRGHEVHVITLLDDGLQEECYEKGFYIHRLRLAKIRLVGTFAFSINIVKMIRKINPDIVHVQSLSCSFPALILKKIWHTPYVVWGQGSDVYGPDWFTKISLRTTIKNADFVIALSEDMKRAVQHIYNREIAIVPNGIELEEYIDKLQMQRKEHTEQRILFVGRLSPEKGVQYLLQAMQVIHGKIPDAKLAIVGYGVEGRGLEELAASLGIRECVDFVGKVPHERIPDYMQQADVFVLPSLSEGLPVVILEAMASGLPIIATRVGGLPDIIEEGVNGYLVEAKNPDAIAEKLLILIKSDNGCTKISINNKKKAQMFAWDSIAEKLEKIYMKSY
jgi:glycosyltransferase involved in cell wall biosynthesis